MRELICTVSGQAAEATKNHKIRISNDRQNYPGYGESDQLFHLGIGQNSLLGTRQGFPRSFDHVQVPQGVVQAKAGRTSRAWKASSSHGRRQGVRLLWVAAVTSLFAAYCVFMAVTCG